MLVVFDLDFTLWDAGGTWCDHTHPPYQKVQDYVEDSDGTRIQLYPDVLKILNYLVEENIQISLASRTYEPSWAKELIKMFGISSYVVHPQIYPDSKLKHFSRLHEELEIPFSNMLFFDDEYRNIRDVSSLGVTTVFVENGIDWNVFQQGLNQHYSSQAQFNL